MLDEVITDADLVASAESVANPPVPTDPAAIPSPPAVFPPPPWEAAPPQVSSPANGRPAPPPFNGTPPLPPGPPIAVHTAPTLGVSAVLTPVPPATVTPLAEAVAAAVLGGHADPAQAARRRRRSASLLPPLPSPSDIPEDAPGRVAIIAMGPPPGDPATAILAEPPGPPPAPATPAPIAALGGENPLAGWLPVLALGAALVLIFVVGVLVTR
jgi:hypothetical protein